MTAAEVQIISVPGWMFPPSVFAPLRQAPDRAFGKREWRDLDWKASLDSGARLREAVAEGSGGVLVAWSLGAMAALQLAADPPSGLRALVLLGATARLPAESLSGYPGVSPSVLAAMRRRLRRDPAGLFHDFHASCRKPGTGVDEDAAGFVAQALEQDAALADAGLALLETLDLRSVVPRIRIPVTLLHGEEDAVVPQAQARALARALPRGRVLTLPGCGHFPDETLLAAADQALEPPAQEETEAFHGL